MSKEGVKLMAEVFSLMQQTRGRLIALGSKQSDTKGGHRDIRMGQMLEEAKEGIKDEFMKITIEETD